MKKQLLNNPKLSVIVLNHNTKDVTIDCLKSLEEVKGEIPSNSKEKKMSGSIMKADPSGMMTQTSLSTTPSSKSSTSYPLSKKLPIN